MTSEISGVNTTVARLQAEFGEAQYNLDQTTVVAPGSRLRHANGASPRHVCGPGTAYAPSWCSFTRTTSSLLPDFSRTALQRVALGR